MVPATVQISDAAPGLPALEPGEPAPPPDLRWDRCSQTLARELAPLYLVP